MQPASDAIMGNAVKNSAGGQIQRAFAHVEPLPDKRQPALLRSSSTGSLPGSAVPQSTFAPLLRSARSNGMFSMLSEADAEILFSFCHFGFVEPGIELFRVDDLAEYMLFIIEGRMNVFCNSSDNQVLRVGTVGIGAIIGESAITSISQRNASVVTVSRCALGYLHHEDFNRLRAAHAETALRFLIMMFGQINGRMRAMVSQLTEANQVRSAAETSLALLSKVLFDRRIGTLHRTLRESPRVERRGKNSRSVDGAR